MNISYCFGMMDLLHYGHIKALIKAKENADYLIFGLVSDKASDEWFGIHASNEIERSDVASSIKYIDEVMIQESFNPLDNLKIIHEKYPDAIITLFHGNEWGILSAKRYIESIGGTIVKLDYYEKFSLDNIAKILTANNDTFISPNNNMVSTKANTLFVLKDLLKKSIIEKMFILTIDDYVNNLEKVLFDIGTIFKDNKIVVRSSSKKEDAFEQSNAGHFESVLGVDPCNQNEVVDAIKKVINSYGNDADKDEQILIQRQTEKVIYSGVVFNRDISRNRPYYVINYDDKGSTDAVTSGDNSKSIWLFHEADITKLPPVWQRLMISIKEIETVLSGTLLDIEFAITDKNVVIFQVRPLAAAYKYGRINKDGEIKKIRNKSIDKYKTLLSNNHSMFSDMAFWNPSEIIGDNPHNLDYSLYREIITKSVYNDALVSMGYSKTDDELMFKFANKPYINLENSFIALTPDGIKKSTKTKLLNFYKDLFKSDVTCHDKIEFEVCFNCFDFSTEPRVLDLVNKGFSKAETEDIIKNLEKITFDNITNYESMLNHDLSSLNQLENKREEIVQKIENADCFALVKMVQDLILAIQKNGTPQFSRQARCAFIAKSLLKSLFDTGKITDDDYHEFLSTIHTIANEYDEDFRKVTSGLMNEKTFLEKYGHLRAGTYNVRSLRYDEMKGLFNKKTKGSINTTIVDNNVEKGILNAIKQELISNGISYVSEYQVVYFVKKSIEQREFFKFIFTKSLSLVLTLIRRIGNILEIDVKSLSYLELPEIYAAQFYSTDYQVKRFWELIIGERRRAYHNNSLLVLPSVITSINDFDYVDIKEARANYITNKIVVGDILVLSEINYNADLNDKIVVVEKADPGFDYIFTSNIKGLITKYGGVASHMSIRCAEFNIPAAIGCGQLLFDYVLNCRRLTLDAKYGRIIKED